MMMNITEFLGIPVEDWFVVKRIIDFNFDGDMDRFKKYFKRCSPTGRNYYTAWVNSRMEVHDLKMKLKYIKKCLEGEIKP